LNHPGLIHLFSLQVEDPVALADLHESLNVVSAEERGEARRFRKPTDGARFLLGRTVVRLALSRSLPIAPGEWRFRRSAFGKPEVARPEAATGIRFNLAHTDGMIVCATSQTSAIGVDVERICAHADLLDAAETVFSATELHALDQLPPEERTARFYDFWTLKEAYAKARGEGLGLDLKACAFHLLPEHETQVRFGQVLNDDPADWFFWRRRLSGKNAVAIAVKSGAGHPPEILHDILALG
jgi:4'-phosphopantetheinyl transferase